VKPAKALNIALGVLLSLALLALALGGFGGEPPSPQAITPIRASELPPEASQTLRLIEQGGPFPYRKDGTTFGNRERLLPGRPQGYYREYTVRTPGAPDRGARRIVAGRQGERYYTADHYRSFRRIVP
jgi:ribonuclease T1